MQRQSSAIGFSSLVPFLELFLYCLQMVSPAHSQMATDGRRSPRAEALLEAYRRGGIDAELSLDICKSIWEKSFSWSAVGGYHDHPLTLKLCGTKRLSQGDWFSWFMRPLKTDPISTVPVWPAASSTA